MVGAYCPPDTHPDPELVDLFRRIRQDARNDPKPAELAQAFSIDFVFDGAGALPTVGMCTMLPIGFLKARLVDAVIVANSIGSATIDLRVGTFTDVPILAQMYGGGTIPTLSAESSVVLDTSTWLRNLHPEDVLMATLMTVSGALLTSLTLSLYCRRLKWAAGSSSVIDTGADVLTDNSGNTVTLRT